jgi:hypothetical protein
MHSFIGRLKEDLSENTVPDRGMFSKQLNFIFLKKSRFYIIEAQTETAILIRVNSLAYRNRQGPSYITIDL